MKETAEVQCWKWKENKVGNDVWRAQRTGLKVSGEVTETANGGQKYLLMENVV